MPGIQKRKRDLLDDHEDSTKSPKPVKTSSEDVAGSTKPKHQQQSRSLFVRSLASSTTTESLIVHFSAEYPIKHGHAVIDPTTQTCKGYGFIAFADAEEAQRALKDLDGSKLLGRKIKLETAEPRKRDLDDTLPGELRQKSQPSAVAIEAKARRQRELEERKKPAEPPKLIVRNLPWSIKEPQQLAALFQPYGKIKYAVVPKKTKGVMAGFGFVTMRDRKNAEVAMKGLNGKEIDGRALAVDWAVEKTVWEDSANKTQTNGDNNVHTNEQGPKTAGAKVVADDSFGDFSSEHEEDGSEHSVLVGDINGQEGHLNSESDEDAVSEESLTTGEDPSAIVGPDNGAGTVSEDQSVTVFVRNLPFTTTDEDLSQHFRQFGLLRYARTVLDPSTERPRGTAFVCFRSPEDAKACIVNAPRTSHGTPQQAAASSTLTTKSRSVLQSEEADPSGAYTLDGRILQLSRAVDKVEATRLAEEGTKQRDKDKRRFYLLSEGTLSPSSALYQKLSPSEIAMREASVAQRKKLMQTNPSLNASLTRLSIRNIPRSITSKDLKALARQAVVGFATDVKEGKREKLSKEELARNGDEMAAAEKNRKRKGVGIVKQAKVVFEGQEGGKVEEKSGGGRSRGYGFIEYYSHRSALMGLRWLNGHAVGYQTKEQGKSKQPREELADKKKRIIVEFAIENAQVVSRRSENESKAKRATRGNPNEIPIAVQDGTSNAAGGPGNARQKVSRDKEATGGSSITGSQVNAAAGKKKDKKQDEPSGVIDESEKLAKRQRIISRKRAARRGTRKGGKI